MFILVANDSLKETLGVIQKHGFDILDKEFENLEALRRELHQKLHNRKDVLCRAVSNAYEKTKLKVDEILDGKLDSIKKRRDNLNTKAHHICETYIDKQTPVGGQFLSRMEDCTVQLRQLEHDIDEDNVLNGKQPELLFLPAPGPIRIEFGKLCGSDSNRNYPPEDGKHDNSSVPSETLLRDKKGRRSRPGSASLPTPYLEDCNRVPQQVKSCSSIRERDTTVKTNAYCESSTETHSLMHDVHQSDGRK